MHLSHRPKYQSSHVVITIKYGGLKATQFFSKYTPEAYQQLLRDLRELGFPFPKKSNIVPLSHGTLEFFWPMGLRERSQFVSNLAFRVDLPEPGVFKDEQIAIRQRLSIIAMAIREDPHYDPSLLQNSGFQFSQVSPVVHVSKKSPPETQQNGVRYHPYSHSQTPATANKGQGHQVSQAKPVSGTARATGTFLDDVGTQSEPTEPAIPRPVQQLAPSCSKVSELPTPSQKSLQEKQTSSPNSSSLPGVSAPTIAPHTTASGPASSGSAPLNSESPVKDHSPTAPSTQNAVPPVSQVVRPSGVSTTPVPPASAPPQSLNPLASRSTPQQRPAQAGGPVQQRPVQANGTGQQRPAQPGGSAQHQAGGPVQQRPVQANGTVQQRPAQPGGSTQPRPVQPGGTVQQRPVPTNGTVQQRPAQSGGTLSVPATSSPSRTQTNATLNVQQLSSDQLINWLSALRKKAEQLVEGQGIAVDELARRKDVAVPSKICLVSSEEVEKATTVKTALGEVVKVVHSERTKHAESKLAMEKVLTEERAKRTEVGGVLETERAKRTEIEGALETERARRVAMEDELKAERTKRIEMENVVKDIERECKSPFIVPALLDAFVQISQATTAAVDHQALLKGDGQ